MRLLLLIAIPVLTNTACATVISGTTKRVLLDVDPPEAYVWVDGQRYTSGSFAELRTNSDHSLRAAAPGRISTNVIISQRMNGLVILSALIGLLPAVIDLATGAAYTLPSRVSLSLPYSDAEVQRQHEALEERRARMKLAAEAQPVATPKPTSRRKPVLMCGEDPCEKQPTEPAPLPEGE